MKPLPAKSNPFRSEQVDALEYRLQNTNWFDLLGHLKKLRYRAAIVGPHGHGKTTLLDALEPRLQECGWSTHRLRLNTSCRHLSPQEWRTVSTLDTSDILLLDGFEQLGLLQQKKIMKLTQRAGGLVVTSHHARFLPTLYQCRTSPQLLRNLIEELEPKCPLNQTAVNALFQRHKGNVRNALRELYDHAATISMG